eukprot:scaffold3015_cov122-Cylindrotheca_fusiformis.AAC.6
MGDMAEIPEEEEERFETIQTCKACAAEQTTSPRGHQRQLIVGITGEVKQLHQSKQKWTSSSQESSYASCEDEEDSAWKEEAARRVEQVIGWGNDAPLRNNPIYAKYFQMISEGEWLL